MSVDPRIIADLITENPDVFNEASNGRTEQEHYIGLAFVGPKVKGQDRKFGAYKLPHRLNTVDFGLLDNAEYYEHTMIYDMNDDKIAEEPLQRLKPMFKKYGCEHGEVVLVYNYEPEVIEKHKQMYGGEVLNGAPDIEEVAGGVAEIERGYLILYKDDAKLLEIPFSHDFAYAVLDNVTRPRKQSFDIFGGDPSTPPYTLGQAGYEPSDTPPELDDDQDDQDDWWR